MLTCVVGNNETSLLVLRIAPTYKSEWQLSEDSSAGLMSKPAQIRHRGGPSGSPHICVIFFLFSFFLFLFVNIFSLLEWKKERERGCERERRLYVRERGIYEREKSSLYKRERSA